MISSGLHEIREVFDLMDTDTQDAWANIAARLAAVPAALAGYRDTLRRGGRRGSRQRPTAAARGRRAVRRLDRPGGRGGTSSPTWWPRPSASGTLRDQLDRHGRRGGSTRPPASAGSCADELAPRGREADAVGRDRYALASRYFLGAAVDLDETYAWGWQELAAHRGARWPRWRDKIVPGGTVDDAVAALDADPARRIAGKERVPGLDAGARRRGDRRARRRALRHPGAGPHGSSA